MRRTQAVLIFACVVGVVAGLGGSSPVRAQPASEVIREGTIVSINRGASSFNMSVSGNPPRELTVFAGGFTQVSVARQGASVRGSFSNLAVGDYVVVHTLTLASGQTLALSTNVVSRAPGGGPATGSTQAGATSGTSSASGASRGSGSSGGIGVSVDASGRGSGGGGGVSVDASGRGGGVSIDASGRGGGVSVDASGRGGGGGGASVDANARGGGN